MAACSTTIKFEAQYDRTKRSLIIPDSDIGFTKIKQELQKQNKTTTTCQLTVTFQSESNPIKYTYTIAIKKVGKEYQSTTKNGNSQLRDIQSKFFTQLKSHKPSSSLQTKRFYTPSAYAYSKPSKSSGFDLTTTVIPSTTMTPEEQKIEIKKWQEDKEYRDFYYSVENKSQSGQVAQTYQADSYATKTAISAQNFNTRGKIISESQLTPATSTFRKFDYQASIEFICNTFPTLSSFTSAQITHAIDAHPQHKEVLIDTKSSDYDFGVAIQKIAHTLYATNLNDTITGNDDIESVDEFDYQSTLDFIKKSDPINAESFALNDLRTALNEKPVWKQALISKGDCSSFINQWH